MLLSAGLEPPIRLLLVIHVGYPIVFQIGVSGDANIVDELQYLDMLESRLREWLYFFFHKASGYSFDVSGELHKLA